MSNKHSIASRKRRLKIPKDKLKKEMSRLAKLKWDSLGVAGQKRHIQKMNKARINADHI